MRALRVMVIAVAMFGLAAPEASAQLRKFPPQVVVPPRPQPRQPRPVRPEQPANRVFWTNLQTVSIGTSLDVELKSGELVRGLMASVDDAGLTLRIDTRLETIARERVDRVSRFQTEAGGKSIAGAVTGLAIGYFVGKMGQEGGLGSAQKYKLMGAGAAVGALGGAVAGAAFQHRIVVYFSR